jgi:hypothetical protein
MTRLPFPFLHASDAMPAMHPQPSTAGTFSMGGVRGQEGWPTGAQGAVASSSSFNRSAGVHIVTHEQE